MRKSTTIDTFVKVDDITSTWKNENMIFNHLLPRARTQDLLAYDAEQEETVYRTAERGTDEHSRISDNKDYYIIKGVAL
jgi:hypothetical protein